MMDWIIRVVTTRVWGRATGTFARVTKPPVTQLVTLKNGTQVVHEKFCKENVFVSGSGTHYSILYLTAK